MSVSGSSYWNSQICMDADLRYRRSSSLFEPVPRRHAVAFAHIGSAFAVQDARMALSLDAHKSPSIVGPLIARVELSPREIRSGGGSGDFEADFAIGRSRGNARGGRPRGSRRRLPARRVRDRACSRASRKAAVASVRCARAAATDK
eukprot:31504-Pelagococcus_subviridis.AAC.11